MNIRDYLNWTDGYTAINREERNLAAVLYHALLLEDNLTPFLALIDCPFDVVESEKAIFVEYAYPRDLWSQIKDNTTKRGLILELLKPSNMNALQEMSVVDFNSYFGAVPRASVKHVQSPGSWSVPRFDRTIKEDDEFLKTCMFKWAFNAKPDIVIHTSRGEAICIEAKLKSSEGKYPQSGGEKKIFQSRALDYVKQTSVQKYLMEDLLGIETQFVFLVQRLSEGKTPASFKLLLWKDVFRTLDLSDLPQFMHEIIAGINT